MQPPRQETLPTKERTRLRRLHKPASKVMLCNDIPPPQRPACIGLEVPSPSYLAPTSSLMKLHVARHKLLPSNLMPSTAIR